jgi:hypothetical protein
MEPRPSGTVQRLCSMYPPLPKALLVSTADVFAGHCTTRTAGLLARLASPEQLSKHNNHCAHMHAHAHEHWRLWSAMQSWSLKCALGMCAPPPTTPPRLSWMERSPSYFASGMRQGQTGSSGTAPRTWARTCLSATWTRLGWPPLLSRPGPVGLVGCAVLATAGPSQQGLLVKAAWVQAPLCMARFVHALHKPCGG